MSSVVVIRRVPPAITGVVGVIRDPAFDAFEERLDWLEAASCLPVIRVDPGDPAAMKELPAFVAQAVTDAGDRGLPMVLVNGVVVSRGVYPTRTQLADWVASKGIRAATCFGSNTHSG